MDSDLHLWFDPGTSTAVLVAQVVAGTVVTLACLVAVRRPWAWPGLAGGLLGAAASVTYLVDHLQTRGQSRQLGAHVFDTTTTPDFPGFVLDRGLGTELDAAQAAALLLVAAAFATGAVLARRRARPAPH